MVTYVKFMINSYEFASRNRREVSVVSSLGHSVAVSDVDASRTVDHDGPVAIYHRPKPKNDHPAIRRILIVLDCLVRLPVHLRGFSAKCLSCHDVIALTIGWLSTLGLSKARRPHLIYDSHEFELGRNTLKPRTRLQKALMKYWEGFLIRRCEFVIAVNDSIADRLQEVHRMTKRPLVVRSTPTTWVLDATVIRGHREKFCSALGLPTDTFIAMYHGGVSPGRGIEELLQAVVGAPDIAVVILGSGEDAYVKQLRSLAVTLGVLDRVLFHPAVPVTELRHYVGAADVGMVLIQAVSESYYLSLPNKLFENVQSLTPVIGSNYPEISRVIHEHHIGLTVNPEDPLEITEALEKLKNDSCLRANLLTTLPLAKSQLCWEREQDPLRRRYADLLGSGTASV